MREQQGIHTNVALRVHHLDVQTQGPSCHHVGASNGIPPEDRPHLRNERRSINKQPAYDDAEDDAIYNTRLPSSARRYAPTTTPPRTVMRVTRHQKPPPKQRAASVQTPVQKQQRLGNLHVSVYIGVAMLCMLIGWIALTTIAHWWQVQQDNWAYGMPRTLQVDANVGHGGMSHFTVENLQGHIIIYEVQLADVAKPHLYLGPVFSGAGADMLPATISFEDVNGDGYSDMIITVGSGRYLLINNHSAFRPVNSSDTISGKGQ